MATVIGISMLGFIAFSGIGQVDTQNVPIVFGAVLGAAALWLLSGKQGKEGWAIGAVGAVLGGILGVYGPNLYGGNTAVYTNDGNISNTQLGELGQRRQIANNLLIAAVRARYGDAGLPPNEQEPNFIRYYDPDGGEVERDLMMGYLFSREADRLGIHLSEDAIGEYLTKLSDGKFSAKQFLELRNQFRVSNSQMISALREELEAWQAYRLLAPGPQFTPGTSGVSLEAPGVTPGMLWDEFKRQKVQAQVTAVPVPAADFVSLVGEPSADQQQELFDQFKAVEAPTPGAPGFMQPRQVQLAYLRVDPKTVQAKVKPVTDAQVQAYYAANKNQFRAFPGVDPSLPAFPGGPAFPGDTPAKPAAGQKPVAPGGPTAPEKPAAPVEPAVPAEQSAPMTKGADAAAQKPESDAPKPIASDTDTATPTESPAPPAADGTPTAPPETDADGADGDGDGANGDGADGDGAGKETSALRYSGSEFVLFLQDDSDPVQAPRPLAKTAPPESPAPQPTPVAAPVQAPRPDPAESPKPEVDTAKPEAGMATPETDTPQPVKPVPMTPEPVKPEPVKPEMDTPDAVTPEPVKPDTVTPDTVTPPAAQAPVPPAIRPLDDALKAEIRGILEREHVAAAVEARAKKVVDDLIDLTNTQYLPPTQPTDLQNADEVARYETERDAGVRKTVGAIEAYARRNGLSFATTKLMTARQLIDSDDPPLGMARSSFGSGGTSEGRFVAQTVFEATPEQLLFPEAAGLGDGGPQYVFMKIADVLPRVPTLTEPGVREAVTQVWKQRQARDQAQARAQELADQVKAQLKSKPQTLAEWISRTKPTLTGKPKAQELSARPLGPFSWYTPAMQMGKPPQLSEVPGLERSVGPEFMQTIFETLKVGDVGTAPAADGEVFYVLQLTDRTPKTEADYAPLLAEFKENALMIGLFQMRPLQQQMGERVLIEYLRNLKTKYEVQWNLPTATQPR